MNVCPEGRRPGSLDLVSGVQGLVRVGARDEDEDLLPSQCWLGTRGVCPRDRGSRNSFSVHSA